MSEHDVYAPPQSRIAAPAPTQASPRRRFWMACVVWILGSAAGFPLLRWLRHVEHALPGLAVLALLGACLPILYICAGHLQQPGVGRAGMRLLIVVPGAVIAMLFCMVIGSIIAGVVTQVFGGVG